MGPPGTATKQQPSSSPTSHSSSFNGLKFGQKIYFEDVGVSSTTPASSSAGPKKGRGGGSVSPALPPRCQVEGCNADLSDAKAYYSRHKVCAMHSKSPSVLVAGLQQRFCQQCSRFHQLPEFDQGKRSCRRRLAGHNERRRKPAPSSLLTSRYSRLSSSIFGQELSVIHQFQISQFFYLWWITNANIPEIMQNKLKCLALPLTDNSGKSGSFLMGFASYPKLSLRTSLPHPRSSEPVSWQGYSEVPSDFFLQGSMDGTSFRGPRHPPQPAGGVADSSCALSLLSSQAWGSSNTAPSLGLNNMWNFNCTPMTQLAASSNHAPIHQLPNTSWCFKGVDPHNCSTDAVPDLGRGQISLQLHGELDDMPQPGRRNYMDPGQSETYESPQWSL